MKIQEALGVETLSEESLKKLLTDSLVMSRAANLMVEFFAPAVIQQMHPMEKSALLKRIGPPPQIAHKVSWSVQSETISGHISIRGNCSRCRQDVAFAGRPADAHAVIWTHCTLGPSTIPSNVIDEYRSRYVPNLISEGKARF